MSPHRVTRRGRFVHFTDRYDDGGWFPVLFKGRVEVLAKLPRRNEVSLLCLWRHRWETFWRATVAYKECLRCGKREAERWCEDGVSETDEGWVKPQRHAAVGLPRR